MPVYRYIAVDLLTHAPLAELPLSGVQWAKTLNAAGTLRASMALPVMPANAALCSVLVDATDPLRRAIYVERDGVLQWGGPIWHRDYDQAASTLTLECADWWSLFPWRLITDDKVYSASTDDQLFIARDLIAYAQAKPGGNLGITVGSEVSGRQRDATYHFYEYKPIAEAIQQMSQLADGFDFSVDVAYDPTGLILRTLHLYYPRQGRIAADTGHVWETGRNIVGFRWTEDGTSTVNVSYALGAGQAESMLRSAGARPDMWAAGYPMLEAAVSYKDVLVQQTLDEHADADVDAHAQPVSLPPIVVRGDIDPVIGAYITGDDARIRIEANIDPRFPDGLDTYRRLISFNVAVPDEGGGEAVTLVFDRTD